ERGASAALPLGAVHGWSGARHVVGPQHDQDVVHRAPANALEDRLEQEALLDVAEAARGARRGPDRGAQPDSSSLLSIVTFSVGVPEGSDGLPSFPIFSTTSMPSVTFPRTA